MSSNGSTPTASALPALSLLGPFQHAGFTALWIATIVSNIGGWMSATATGWLMTGLSPEPFVVSLVQVATTLPMFLLAIPAAAMSIESTPAIRERFLAAMNERQRTPAQRRLWLGRFRGLFKRGADGGDPPRGVMAGTLAPA